MFSSSLRAACVLALTGTTAAFATLAQPPARPARRPLTTFGVSPAPVRTAARPTTRQDHLVEALTQRWSGAVYRDSLRSRYTRFDANDNALERIIESHETGSWVMRQRRTVTFRNGYQTADTLFSYLNRPLIATRRTYTAAGRPDTIISRSSFLTGTWQPARRDHYQYDGNGFPELFQQEDWISVSYVETGRDLYTVDVQGRIVVDEFQTTGLSGLTYFPFYQAALTYVGTTDSLATAIIADWDTTTRTYSANVQRYRNTYSAAGLLDTVYAESYNVGPPATWSLGALTVYAYDARQNRISEEVSFRPNPSSPLIPFTRRLFTYDIVISGAAPEVLAAESLVLTPNPAADAATLRYTLTAPAPVTVELLDVLGRRVLTPTMPPTQAAGAHTAALDLRGLPAGLYVARVTAGSARRQVKLVVQ